MKTLDLPKERYKSLFQTLLRIRIIEEKIAEIYPEQEMRCPVHLCIGEEAVAVGVCANLGSDDYVLSNHRSHGHYLAKGGNLKAMMAEIYGKATGCCQGKGGSMHLVDLSVGFLGATPIVGSTIPIAVGVALGTVMRGEKRVSVVFMGDAATEEGVFHESLNFAALKKLPVVFVCENNLYSVYSPLSVRQPEGREIFRLAQGHGVDSFQGDGNNVVEVYKLAGQAINQAREGNGPLFLEFKTYRWREHCGPNYDNDLGYRTESEFLEWRQRCPVQRLQEHLLQEGILSQRELDHMARRFEAEMEEAIAFAKESPFPTEANLLEHICCP
ncbi:MAG: thiamine pyrophosphate-dependent dehydrogenase E1 component subunit alpha [Dehalococcoidales bacterium]|nr:thiamine pyrophosphate-dependent dehydrogenase E1 component subunit alpha [Dehalococcoidales bacterium]